MVVRTIGHVRPAQMSLSGMGAWGMACNLVFFFSFFSFFFGDKTLSSGPTQVRLLSNEKLHI